jgi:hypothetical protein
MLAGRFVLPTTGIVTGANGFNENDKVVIDRDLNTKEENYIKAVIGNKLLLDEPLKYAHDYSGVIINRFQGANEITEFKDPNISSLNVPRTRRKSLSAVNSNTGSIVVSASTSNLRNLIHQTDNGDSDYEEIWLWAHNSDEQDVDLTIEFGGLSFPANQGQPINYRDDSVLKFTVPKRKGLYKIFAGFLLQNSLRLTAFADAANKITLYGYINKVIQSDLNSPTLQGPMRLSDSVVGWGENFYGQASVPGSLSFTKERTVKSLAAGYNNSFAILGDDNISGWGTNINGQLNIPNIFETKASTTTAIQSVEKISIGCKHVLALYTDSNQNTYIKSWGYYDENTVPLNLGTIVDIAAGSEHNLALINDGTVIGWGKNDHGQALGVPSSGLMTGTLGGNVSGASGELLQDVTALSAGSSHSLALRTDSGVVAWGSNWGGQSSVPSEATEVIQIAAGLNHSLALKSGGAVISWGDNGHGQCDVPTGISISNTGIIGIAAAGNTSLAWKNDGEIIVWGKSTKLVNSPNFKLKSVYCGVEHAIATDISGLSPNGTPVI